MLELTSPPPSSLKPTVRVCEALVNYHPFSNRFAATIHFQKIDTRLPFAIGVDL